MSELLQWDQSVFFWINQDAHSAVLDWLLPLWRIKYTWIPLYVLLGGIAFYQYRRKAWWWLVFLLAVVGTGDTVSHRLIKKQVQRPRPCKTAEIRDEVRLLINCGSGYSFTSNHATNHFAMAAFFSGTIGLFFRSWRWLFWLWAAMVAYAQVYVGVHYPLDVLAGALLGTLIGTLGVVLWKLWV